MGEGTRMEVVTLTLNPCVDRTLWVRGFGEAPERIEEQSGGKGVNVARVLGALGIDCAAVFPAGGETGDKLIALARAEGVQARPVPVKPETRVIDTEARLGDFAQQVHYVRGEALGEADLDALEAELFRCLPGARVLAVCGSASSEAAARRVPGIIRRAKALGVAVLLDSNGPALIEGAEALPDIVKPNQKELGQLVGRDVVPGEEADAALELVSRGIGGVLVSLGEGGCAYLRADGQYFCPAPKVETVNPVGSGDSFVAGFLYGVLRGWPDNGRALVIACAAGAANARMFPAARVGRAEIEALCGEI